MGGSQGSRSARLVIRRFREKDKHEVTDLWLKVFPDDPPWSEPGAVIRRKLAIQSDLFWVGSYQGKIVATVLAGYDGHRGWIYHLAVAPGHRRKGFARKIMVAAETRLKALGCPKINLQVRDSNEAVVRFYQGIGYATEERISMGKRLRR
jgi:ribosomal protein S18 acetylase RimI-like enzyme